MKKFIFLAFIVFNYVASVGSAYSKSLKFITPEKFIEENNSPERYAIVNFITNQVKDKPKVTQKKID